MSVIELTNDDIEDLKDGYMVRLKLDGKNRALVGPDFAKMGGVQISEKGLNKLINGEMIKLEHNGRKIGIIGPKFELD